MKLKKLKGKTRLETEPGVWDYYYDHGRIRWNSLGASKVTLNFLSAYSSGNNLLEIACGAGQDSQAFAAKGYKYLGIDVSPAAIMLAKKKNKIFPSLFRVENFFDWKTSELFDVAYDKGMFHNLAGPRKRSLFAKRVAGVLRKQGIWITVCGAADNYNPKTPHGAVFLQHIITPIERYFEVLEVVKAPYGIKKPYPDFQAWYCVFRRR